MKRLSIFIVGLLLPLLLWSQGWPSNYGGVMLQGFYWDSYNDSKWTNLESQADELSKYFDIIWVPFSGRCVNLDNTDPSKISMGYNPKYWFNHNSSFGTEAELRSMIQAYKRRGTIIMEDVVLNHKEGINSWCDFAEESWNGNDIKWTLADICQNDDGGNTLANGFLVSGKDDEGDDFSGLRDLDHTSANVQHNIKLFLDYLLNDLGYGGFRYDMVKGFAGRYVGKYNAEAQAKFSVGEYWDGDYNRIKGWIDSTSIAPEADGKIQSAAFDFPLQIGMKHAFNESAFTTLSNKGLAGDKDQGMNRYSVTFVDNHDTFREHAHKIYNNILAANAYILALPGTPCIFLQHWLWYKEELKKMIMARKVAGITNQSVISKEETKGNATIITVSGKSGQIRAIIGYAEGVDLEGFTAISTGTPQNPNYAFYLSNDCVDAYNYAMSIEKNGNEGSTEEPLLTYDAKASTVYFENVGRWDEVCVYAWDAQDNKYDELWPGKLLTEKVGKSPRGYDVYKWTYAGSKTTNPSMIIFNNNDKGNQTANLSFKNGGYYDHQGLRDEEPIAVNAVLERNFTAGQRSTVCLPFNLTSDEVSRIDGTLYEFKEEANGVLVFDVVNELKAYEPYVFVANQTGKSFEIFKDKTWMKGNPITVTKGSFSFKGTMTRLALRPLANTKYYAYNAADGQFSKAGSKYGITVKPSVCYFYSKDGSEAKIMELENGITNQISIEKMVNENDDNAPLYNLSGQQVTKHYKGIVIQNGRKRINN